MWAKLGVTCFWLTWPLIYVYSSLSKPRTRVLLLHGSEVLLVQNWLSSGRWGLPGGGKKRGEAPQVAAAREVAEELGIHVDPKTLQPLGQYVSREAGLPSRYHLFVVRFETKPDYVHEPREIMAVQWLSHAGIAQNDTVGTTVISSLVAWSAAQNLVS